MLLELGGLEGVTRARYADAEAAAARALAVAQSLQQPAVEARAALVLADTRGRAGEPLAARPLLARALERALAAGDPALAAEACVSLSNHHYFRGELRVARSYAHRRLELARAAGGPFALRHGHTWLALIAISFGDWEQARELLREAEALLGRLDSPEPRAFHTMMESYLLVRLGHLEEALARAAEAVAVFERVGPATAIWYAAVPALLRAWLGRRAEVEHDLALLEERLAALPESALPARSARTAMALAYAALGDRERGAACERCLRPYADDYHWSPTRLSLAALAALRGDQATALADLAAAEVRARREGLRPDLVLILLARAALPRSAPRLRSRDLAEARGLAQALGMRRELEQADRLARSTPFPAGLTEREVEVLRLVAQGKSNREIAEALVLSERTVINHLSHIFQKTDTDNRAAATAFALRHGIA